MRKSPEYYEEKVRLLGLVIEAQRDDGVLSPIEMELIQVSWYEKPRKPNSRIGNGWGSYLSNDLLHTLEKIGDA